MTQDHTSSQQTGPKTTKGKRRSSLNALKHGLRARAPHAVAAIEGDCRVEFQPYLDKAKAYYQPWDPIEEEMVNHIARCLWRLARAADMDHKLTQTRPEFTRPSHSAETIIKYERLVNLELHRTIRALERKRAPRPLSPFSTSDTAQQ